MFDKVTAYAGQPVTITTTDGATVLGTIVSTAASFFDLSADTVGNVDALRPTLAGGYRLAYADVAEIA